MGVRLHSAVRLGARPRRLDLGAELRTGPAVGCEAWPAAASCGRASHGLGDLDPSACRAGGRDRIHPPGLGSLLPFDPARLSAARGGRGCRGCRRALALVAGAGGSMSHAPSFFPGDASAHAQASWRVPFWVCAILLASYAFFWQARDWNSASRLMLTYALVDRGTLSLDGLEEQTRDIAYFRGRHYTDKLPGFSLLAVVPYMLAKTVFWFPDHPLNQPGFPYWPADYWVTLGTSGLATAV